jgi:hypothetical protein
MKNIAKLASLTALLCCNANVSADNPSATELPKADTQTISLT